MGGVPAPKRGVRGCRGGCGAQKGGLVLPVLGVVPLLPAHHLGAGAVGDEGCGHRRGAGGG